MLPYVYICVHRETKEFYIGYRSQNKLSPEQDLGNKYFTSSKIVKPRFHEFETKILSTFNDKVEAHTYEQNLIREHWGNPLLLNRALFPMIKHNGSEKQSDKAQKRMLENNPMKLQANKDKARSRNLGKKHTEKTKQKMSKSRKGKKLPNKKMPDQSGANNYCAKMFIFIDPNGVNISVKGGLRKFCVENGLGYNSMLDLGAGKRENYKGWRLLSKNKVHQT